MMELKYKIKNILTNRHLTIEEIYNILPSEKPSEIDKCLEDTYFFGKFDDGRYVSRIKKSFNVFN